MPKRSSDKQKEAARIAKTTHGLYGTKEYRAWISMKRRCYNPNCLDYKNYGGRGISVCQEWRDDYLKFLNHIGKAPSNSHTLDRINNEGNYEPGNVRWATRAVQNLNTRRQYAQSL